MRSLLVIVAACCYVSSLQAGGVTWGFSQGGGYFVIGGGYRTPTYGLQVTQRDPYARNGYGYYGRGPRHYGRGYNHHSCGDSCCSKKTCCDSCCKKDCDKECSGD